MGIILLYIYIPYRTVEMWFKNMGRVDFHGWMVYRWWRWFIERGGGATDPFNLIFFQFSFISRAETCVTNINHQSSNDGKICLAHVTRSIIRWWQRRRRRN